MFSVTVHAFMCLANCTCVIQRNCQYVLGIPFLHVYALGEKSSAHFQHCTGPKSPMTVIVYPIFPRSSWPHSSTAIIWNGSIALPCGSYSSNLVPSSSVKLYSCV